MYASADPGDDLDLIINRYDPLKKWTEDNKDVDYRQANERSLAIIMLVRFYQRFISSQKPHICVFYPSCSEYAKLALEEHGVTRGLLMIADRILRCNSTMKSGYPLHSPSGRFHDPP